MKTMICQDCGLKTAIRIIRGQLSSQYSCGACGACGANFERDNPACDRGEVKTQARLLWEPDAETQVERCRRVLAAVPKVRRAADFYIQKHQPSDDKQTTGMLE